MSSSSSSAPTKKPSADGGIQHDHEGGHREGYLAPPGSSETTSGNVEGQDRGGDGGSYEKDNNIRESKGGGGDESGEQAEHQQEADIHEAGGSAGFLEVTLISAQGLKDVRMFGNMSPYAVVWIDPDRKHRTRVAPSAGSSPVWDHHLRLPLPDADTCQPPNLCIQVYNHGAVSDTLVGSAHIALSEATRNLSCDRPEYMACQLVRPSGRIQGLVNLSLRLSLQHRPPPGRNSWFFPTLAAVDHDPRHATDTCRSTFAPDYLDQLAPDCAGCSEGAPTTPSSSSSSASDLPTYSLAPMTGVAAPAAPAASNPRALIDSSFDTLALSVGNRDISQLPNVLLTGQNPTVAALMGMSISQLAPSPNHGAPSMQCNQSSYSSNPSSGPNS